MFMNDYVYTPYGNSFDVEDGEHEMRIKSAKVAPTKTGKQMIEITYQVAGSNGIDFIDRIVEGDYFGANMSRFFDAFNIQVGNFNFNSWIGKVGKGIFRHKENTFTDQNGNTKTSNRAELAILIVKKDNNAPAAQMPPQNAGYAPSATPPQGNNGFPIW